MYMVWWGVCIIAAGQLVIGILLGYARRERLERHPKGTQWVTLQCPLCPAQIVIPTSDAADLYAHSWSHEVSPS